MILRARPTSDDDDVVTGPPGEHLAARVEALESGCQGRCDPRLLVVGEHNSYGGDPEYALYPKPEHSAGGRLPEILGITDVELARAWRVNLCPEGWRRAESLRRAELLLEGPWDRYLLCGQRVRGAFQYALGIPADTRSQPTVHRWAVAGKDFLAIPHPSGRSRRWNEVGVRAEVAAAFAALWRPE